MVRPFLNIGFIGLVAILLSIAVHIIYPNEVPNIQSGFHVPVFAFEFIQNTAQVEAFFGLSTDAPEIDFVQKSMEYGSYFDYLLLATFLLFYIAFLFKIRTSHKTFFYFITIAFALLSAVADGFQNFYILQINTALETGGYSTFIMKLVQASWVKYLSLSLVYWMLLHFFMNQKYSRETYWSSRYFSFSFRTDWLCKSQCFY